MFVSAVKIVLFWFGVYVVSGTFGDKLKRTHKEQFSTHLHQLHFLKADITAWS